MCFLSRLGGWFGRYEGVLVSSVAILLVVYDPRSGGFLAANIRVRLLVRDDPTWLFSLGGGLMAALSVLFPSALACFLLAGSFFLRWFHSWVFPLSLTASVVVVAAIVTRFSPSSAHTHPLGHIVGWDWFGPNGKG